MVMTHKLMASILVSAMVVTTAPMPAAADTLRAIGAQDPATRAGLEESLLGQKIRRASLRWGRYLALAGLAFQLAQSPNLPVPQAAPPTPPQSAATLPRAIVSPTTLTLTLPAAVTGQPVAAYLFTDQGYRVGTNTVPENGTVTFTVSVNPPNFPGWVAARDRVIAVFPRGAAPPDTSATPTIRGATLAARLATNGQPTVVTGQWPASPFQVGAGPFGPLRQFLGPDRQIGLIVEGDPAQILTLTRAGTDFFGSVVHAGYNTVWVNGAGFTQLSPGARQEIVIRAANAQLRTLGFIQSAVGLSNSAVQAATLRAFDDQFQAVLGLDLGSVTVQWMTDFEEQLAPPSAPWNGDMAPVMDTIERVVAGARQLEQDYRARRSNMTRSILATPAVWQFGGTWLANGSRPDPAPGLIPGAIVHNIRPESGTGLAGATFQTDEKVIAETGDQVSRRAAEESAALQTTSATFMYVVESAPLTDGKTFDGQVPRAGPALQGAVQRIPKDRLLLLGGVAVHASDAANALSGLQQLLLTTTVAVSPNGRTYVWRDTANGLARLQFWTDTTSTGSYTMPAAFTTTRLLPQFVDDNYLFLLAQNGSGASRSDGFVVFGARRAPPGSARSTWSARPLHPPQDTRTTVFLDRDPSDPAAGGPILMQSILPNFGPPDPNDIAIRYSFTSDPTAPPRTMVLTIEPTGLEEEQDQFLREERGVQRDTGRLA